MQIQPWEKRPKNRLVFDSDSYDILIDNCCSHTLTNDLKDYIEPPIKSKVKIRGYNGSTNSTRVGTVKWKIKDDNGKVHNFILPNTFFTDLQLKLDYCHHNIGLKSGTKEETHTV